MATTKINKNVIIVKTLSDSIKGKKPDQVMMKTLKIGETKEKNKKTYIVVKNKNILNWEEIKLSPVDKVKEYLKNSDEDVLIKYARNTKNDPTLRQLVYEELIERI